MSYPVRLPLPSLFFLIFLLVSLRGHTQWMSDYLGDEYLLYRETKQVNQFFRRFNAEELPSGRRLRTRDSLYHSDVLRKEYLGMVFDESNPYITDSIKSKFIQEVMDGGEETILNFHGGEWFAEVWTTFAYRGRLERVLLFLSLEKAEIGSKWVLTNVYFEPFQKIFDREEAPQPNPPFIHPLSHELDFMNLIKVFRNGGNLEPYAGKDYEPDYLTLFLYEIKKKNLSFRSVDKVSFHFFQLKGWYFGLSEIRREGENRGWLISQITRVPDGQKKQLLNFIIKK